MFLQGQLLNRGGKVEAHGCGGPVMGVLRFETSKRRKVGFRDAILSLSPRRGYFLISERCLLAAEANPLVRQIVHIFARAATPQTSASRLRDIERSPAPKFCIQRLRCSERRRRPHLPPAIVCYQCSTPCFVGGAQKCTFADGKKQSQFLFHFCW